MKRVAVLIVSGFLGSGKTTLVRQILTRAQESGLKVGIVSNEFGELGIDAALLGAGEQRYVELAGGCICCELTDELIETLELIRTRVDPDWIIIETSGVALPFETQLNLYRPEVRDWVGDEAVVVVVDAETLLEGPADPGTFETQISAADLLLLHKIDLLPASAIQPAQDKLQALNPDTPIVCASYGNIPLEILFPQGPQSPFPALPTPSCSLGCDHDHDHDHDHHHAHHPHQHTKFHSFELHLSPNLTPEEVTERVLAQKAVRAKGFAQTPQGLHIVQGVGRRVEVTPTQDAILPELWGRVVIIQLSG